MKLLLVDDQNVVRETLANALTVEEGIDVVIQAEGAKEAITLQQRHRFDVAVIELSLADRTGTELIRELKTFADTRVLVLSICRDEFSVGEAMRAGADGYLSKRSHLRDLVDAIRTVARGEARPSQANPATTTPPAPSSASRYDGKTTPLAHAARRAVMGVVLPRRRAPHRVDDASAIPPLVVPVLLAFPGAVDLGDEEPVLVIGQVFAHRAVGQRDPCREALIVPGDDLGLLAVDDRRLAGLVDGELDRVKPLRPPRLLAAPGVRLVLVLELDSCLQPGHHHPVVPVVLVLFGASQRVHHARQAARRRVPIIHPLLELALCPHLQPRDSPRFPGDAHLAPRGVHHAREPRALIFQRDGVVPGVTDRPQPRRLRYPLGGEDHRETGLVAQDPVALPVRLPRQRHPLASMKGALARLHLGEPHLPPLGLAQGERPLFLGDPLLEPVRPPRPERGCRIAPSRRRVEALPHEGNDAGQRDVDELVDQNALISR